VAQTDGHDGVVTALEASGMDLRGTQLVVLSACDSGRGDAVRGQGVLGLRRAFLLAGAESVVATLWPVNDWSTAFFMRHFYAQLQAGAARSDALQYAMQRMIETEGKAEPHLWSPFVLIGQDGPIQFQPTASPPPAPRP
jgi:CHAT domain-containing protein